MLALIEDLPPDILGVEAAGKVTHEDYQKILIPWPMRMVGDQDWLRTAVGLFKTFSPCAARLFGLADLPRRPG
jgi:hypothetical protein